MHSDKDTNLILVIEDDKDYQILEKMLLESNGYNVLTASCGLDALDILKKTIPDLILLDLVLPDITGLQVAEYLSSEPNLRDIPIIVMSADDTAYAIEEAYQHNVYEYIIKPINPTLFVKQINSTLFTHTMKNEFELNKKRLTKVQQLGGIGTWVYHPQNKVFKCSNEFLLLIESDDTSVEYEKFLSFIHKDDREEFREKLLNSMDAGIPFTVQHRIINNDGMESVVIHSVSGDVNKYQSQFVLTGTVMDITDRLNDQSLISYTRFHDKVTGLPNHESFCNRLNSVIVDANKSERLMGVLMLGVDKFKNINETMGRDVGDMVLVALAERFKEYVGVEVYRYAGDIFAFILKDMRNVQFLESVSEKIFASLNSPLLVKGETVYLSVSIGSAIYPMITGGKNDLINAVESAMYQAKRIGGDRAVYFDINHYNSMKNIMMLESDIRKALDNNEFEVYYQPQVSVPDSRLIGMEALIRWNHPEYGLVSPDQFIPIAEEIGVIIPLGNWVMETAIKQIRQWYNQGYGLLRIGVNLSPYQFDDKNLFSNTVKLIEKYKIPPCGLDIEITESAAMRDVEHTIKILDQFNEYGILSSMDDFGTGYSSLSYLEKMPLHTIKIDRSFISDITKTGENGELAKIIIAMSHSLGRNVIAEGVETEAHLNFLKRYKCAEAQGYYFSRPVTAKQFEDFFINPDKYNFGYSKPSAAILFTENQ